MSEIAPTLAAGRSTVGSLFQSCVRRHRERCAVEAAGRALTYGELDARVNRAVEVLRASEVARGDRVAILSENRPEYLELELACAKLGAILACQNWRLAPPELRHCITLVSPTLLVVSERHAEPLARAGAGAIPTILLGADYEGRLARARPGDPEDRESGG